MDQELPACVRQLRRCFGSFVSHVPLTRRVACSVPTAVPPCACDADFGTVCLRSDAKTPVSRSSGCTRMALLPGSSHTTVLRPGPTAQSRSTKWGSGGPGHRGERGFRGCLRPPSTGRRSLTPTASGWEWSTFTLTPSSAGSAANRVAAVPTIQQPGGSHIHVRSIARSAIPRGSCSGLVGSAFAALRQRRDFIFLFLAERALSNFSRSLAQWCTSLAQCPPAPGTLLRSKLSACQPRATIPLRSALCLARSTRSARLQRRSVPRREVYEFNHREESSSPHNSEHEIEGLRLTPTPATRSEPQPSSFQHPAPCDQPRKSYAHLFDWVCIWCHETTMP